MGKIGGNMVKKMVEFAEREMDAQNAIPVYDEDNNVES
ncbi:small acid-soluble spore protein alpha/beta type [Calderihabitans maritimus]|uniref:Small acid-soluble spore protein alpha/beta type n=1 Tax=Calderihabitans maritimus TaxID=1246530 RepID=A0A1Z5HT94_9FIRM|nr:small acid-soluble spore protein alpha/beta type [Calderihabitans maritimus]